MTGTPLVSTTKFELTTKGPETGHYLCSNSSGNFGPRLREAGFDGLILEGASERWTAVVIENESVKFVDDDGWQGLAPMEARERLLGQLPESVRKNVRVVDRMDEAAKQLPRVPWCYDIAERYQKRYGEDLLPRRKSLFTGDAAEDRAVRRQFWALVADLVAERYFGQIQKWCQANGVAASGHCLWEEEVLHHVSLVGNCLKALSRMDIPGLDMLTSEPSAVIHSGWMAAAITGLRLLAWL